MNRDEFGSWLRAERSLVEFDGWFLECEQPAKQPHISATVADYHYGQYSSLYEEQERLFSKAGNVLLTAVSRSSRLERVKAGPCTHLTPYSVPSLLDVRVRDGWQDGMGLYQLDLDHSIMVLTALSQGQTMAGSRLDISKMFHLFDAMIMGLPGSANSAQIENFIPDVKSLPISINTFDRHGFQDLLESGACANFLGLMTNLESLFVSTSHVTTTAFSFLEVSQIFGDKTWPHLRHLELDGFWASASELSNLFRRHKSTLDILVLRNVLLDSGSWYQVLADLRGGALRDISVGHLRRGGFDLDFHDYSDDPEFIPLPEAHPLLTFLFKGGPWVKEMDDLLEGDDLETEDSEEVEVQEESEEDDED